MAHSEKGIKEPALSVLIPPNSRSSFASLHNLKSCQTQETSVQSVDHVYPPLMSVTRLLVDTASRSGVQRGACADDATEATLANPNTSMEAKEHSEQVLKEMAEQGELAEQQTMEDKNPGNIIGGHKVRQYGE